MLLVCEVNDAQVAVLAKALATNTSLTTLKLRGSYNQCSDELNAKIELALQRNRQLPETMKEAAMGLHLSIGSHFALPAEVSSLITQQLLKQPPDQMQQSLFTLTQLSASAKDFFSKPTGASDAPPACRVL